MSKNKALEQAKGWLVEQGINPPTEVSASVAGTCFEAAAGFAVLTPPVADSDTDVDSHTDADADSDADPVAVARSIVVRKLSVRAHTRCELEQALKARHVPDEVAETVLDRMTELGLIDDAAFAQEWVDSRQQRRHLSRRALRQELVRRGVERETIEAALEEVDGEDELAAARALVEKKRAALERVDAKVRHRRLAGLLGRRGYSSAVVAMVLDETLRPRAE